MATPVVMPRQGNTVESCTITEWKKLKGDAVKEGDILFVYETDKASFEFTAPASGTLLDIFFDPNTDIPVLTNVAVIGNTGENYDALKPAGSAPSPAPAPQAMQPVAASSAPAVSSTPSQPSAAPAVQSSGAVSPRARTLAAEKGIDTSSLAGTGPKGRVIARDVAEAVASGPRLTPSASAKLASGGLTAPSSGTGIGGRIRVADLLAAPASAAQAAGVSDSVTEVKLSKIRTIIADRMMGSLKDSAQLTMNTSANASGLLAFRAKVKAAAKKLDIADVNITDMVVFALSRVLPRFPEINATIEGDVIRQYAHAHVALAVDTPRGLMVPVVKYADCLSLSDLSTALKTVAAQCNDGSINPDNLSGGTLTLSNLGTFGIESFTPVLNRPQVAILGLCTISPKPVAGPDGAYTMVPHIGLSLTIDHRAVDGAPAARFLKALVDAIENIELTLAR